MYFQQNISSVLSGTIIRGTLKAPNSQLVTPISIKLQRPDGCEHVPGSPEALSSPRSNPDQIAGAFNAKVA
jgi:hypothetical protein